jgi:hypothetical protein
MIKFVFGPTPRNLPLVFTSANLLELLSVGLADLAQDPGKQSSESWAIDSGSARSYSGKEEEINHAGLALGAVALSALLGLLAAVLSSRRRSSNSASGSLGGSSDRGAEDPKHQLVNNL